jgi:hypothetical protein
VTLELGPDDKRMSCATPGAVGCAAAHSAGAEAIYERARRRSVAWSATNRQSRRPRSKSNGEAGASARREYERRRDAREQRIRGEHPKLGGLILALSDDPQSTKAWERGAVGEELMAKRLADVPDTFRVMHDRRIRGTRRTSTTSPSAPPASG